MSPHREVPGWALDDLYIGEKCEDLCNGRGDCFGGRCKCDPGYIGETILIMSTIQHSK